MLSARRLELAKQKQQQESIPAGKASNLRETGRSSIIQDRSWKCPTEEKEILNRWTEYWSELYNHDSCGDNAVLDCSQPLEEDLQLIFREEAEIAVASLKQGNSAGVDYTSRTCSSWWGDHD